MRKRRKMDDGGKRRYIIEGVRKRRKMEDGGKRRYQ